MLINTWVNEYLNKSDSSWITKYFNAQSRRGKEAKGQRPQLVTNNTAYQLRISWGCRDCQSLCRSCVLMSCERGVTTWLFRGKDLSILLNMHLPHHFKAEASNGFHVERSPSQVLPVWTVILFCVHGTAAQGLLKMLWLLCIVDLSAWKWCQSVFRGRIFYTNEIKYCRESSGKKRPMQWWKHSNERYICKRSNCRFGNYNFPLGLNEIFLAPSISMWTGAPVMAWPGCSALTAHGSPHS